MNILIVEDEWLMATMIKKAVKNIPSVNLVDIAATVNEAKSKFKSHAFDMALIDIHLSDDHLDGIDLCKMIRLNHPNIPLLIISGDSSLDSLKKAFDLYVNDYIKKPFRPQELILRVKRWLICPARLDVAKKISYKKILYDPKINEFYNNGAKIPLTKKSKFLFLLFLKNPECLLETDYLKEKLWGYYDVLEKNRNLRSNIQILRQALERAGLKGSIRTERGEGYMLKI